MALEWVRREFGILQSCQQLATLGGPPTDASGGRHYQRWALEVFWNFSTIKSDFFGILLSS